MSLYKEKKIAGFFIFVNLFYLTQGIVPALGSLYTLMLLILLVISAYYFVIVNTTYNKSVFIKALNILVLMFTVYGFLHFLDPLEEIRSIIPDYRAYTYLTNAYKPLLQIYPLYYFSRKGYIDEDVIKTWIIPATLCALAAFYVKNQEISISLLTNDVVGTTNNTGYLIVSVIPLLFFSKKNIISYSILAIVIAFVFISSKRGAIILAALCTVWFIFFDLKMSPARKKLWVIPLVIVAGVVLFVFLSRIFEESYYMQYVYEKTLDGDSSGRDVLYNKAWDHFINKSSFTTMLLGNGADSTYCIIGNRAHNDWLELLMNQGLLGVFVYLFFWFSIFKTWLRNKSQKFIYAVLGSIIILFFLRTLVSMLYNDLSPIACLPFAWCMAYCDSKSVKYKNS